MQRKTVSFGPETIKDWRNSGGSPGEVLGGGGEGGRGGGGGGGGVG